MTKKSNYKVSERYKEILDVLQKAVKSEKNFFWRKKKRDQIPVSLKNISINDNTIELSLKDLKRTSFKLNEEIYIKLDARDSGFKSVVQSISANSIKLEFPDAMVVTEKRSEDRYYFHPSDEKVIQIKKAKSLGASISERMFSLNVADISYTGVAVLLSQNHAVALNVKDRIALEAVGTSRIYPPILGDVVFKMPIEIKGAMGRVDSGIKIGIQFDKKIPQNILERFIIKEHVFSLSEEQIIRDENFRKEVHNRMDQMQKQFSQKKNLKDIFEKLDPNSDDQQYLKKHIELLCEVMCGLGTQLGWVSDVTMDKLIYVAYMHDARFFTVPHLARIPSKKEFDRIRPALGDEDQKAFLEAPEYASNLAHNDNESYPDVAKILIQQKEVSNGTGFPYGITTPSFLPLSCLFIISHHFVDYAMMSQEWTVDDFIKTYQKSYKGVYFQKVFQAMKGNTA